MKAVQSAVFLAVAAVTGCYYHWGVRAAGNDFQWRHKDLDGYYNLLTRGFMEGHLYLSFEPDPKLLAYPNPLDPHIPDEIPKLFDAVLFNRHYYLYHGAGPAILLFLPYRLVTGYDLPENFALFLLCFGGYLFAAFTLLSMMRLMDASPAPWALAFPLFALGFCQSIPFLLNRVWVYEVAIGGGYFCVSAGLFFLTRAIRSPRTIWPVCSAIMLALAVACRPHLIIVAVFGLVAFLLESRKHALAFVIPLAAVGSLIAAYNFERFGNPAEFGLRYQITGPFLGEIHLRAANVLPGLYYMLFTRPDFTPVFPWILMPWPARDMLRPPLYFVEPIVGAIFLAPFLPASLASPFIRNLRAMRWVPLASACCIVAFLVATGFSTQRYEVDFLPLFVLASMPVAAWWTANSPGVTRAVANAALIVTVTFGIVVNLAMGITGPYDDMMKNKPTRYVTIAKWLSPIFRFRPLLDPPLKADLQAAIVPAHSRVDLLSVGRPPLRYELFVDYANGKAVLVSRIGATVLTKELPENPAPAEFHVEYSPGSREMVVMSNGAEILRQPIGRLITAPSQIDSRSRILSEDF